VISRGSCIVVTSRRACSRISPRSCGPGISRCGGSQAYANWAAQLLPWEQCEGLLDEFCAETGLPASAREFTDQLRAKLTEQAATVDAKYPENTDLVIDPATGVPSLKRRRASKSGGGRAGPGGSSQGADAGADAA
jgi:hypothetical protein